MLGISHLLKPAAAGWSHPELFRGAEALPILTKLPDETCAVSVCDVCDAPSYEAPCSPHKVGAARHAGTKLPPQSGSPDEVLRRGTIIPISRKVIIAVVSHRPLVESADLSLIHMARHEVLQGISGSIGRHWPMCISCSQAPECHALDT